MPIEPLENEIVVKGLVAGRKVFVGQELGTNHVSLVLAGPRGGCWAYAAMHPDVAREFAYALLEKAEEISPRRTQ